MQCVWAVLLMRVPADRNLVVSPAVSSTVSLPSGFVLRARGMATDTILQVADALVPVLILDFGRVVAIVAGIAPQIGRMAGLARTRSLFAVVKRKGVGAIVACRCPGVRGMAGSTVAAQQAGMVGWLAMAGKALPGCTPEHAIHVALHTFHVAMCPRQREGGQRMVKGGRLPILRCVALGAILAELAGADGKERRPVIGSAN